MARVKLARLVTRIVARPVAVEVQRAGLVEALGEGILTRHWTPLNLAKSQAPYRSCQTLDDKPSSPTGALFPTIPFQMVRQMTLEKTALVYLGERKEGSRDITSRNSQT